MKVRNAVLMILALTFAAAAQTNNAPQGLFPFSGDTRQEVIKDGPVSYTVTHFNTPAGQFHPRLSTQGVLFMLKTTDATTTAYLITTTARLVNGDVLIKTFTVTRQTDQPEDVTFGFQPLSAQAVTFLPLVTVTELKDRKPSLYSLGYGSDSMEIVIRKSPKQ